MKVHLPNEGYFRHLYDAVFLILFFVPELLVFLSLVFRFPLFVSLTIIAIIVSVLTALTVTMSVKVLPDLRRNEDLKDMMEG